MPPANDFDRLLGLLRSGTIPPDELARLARCWSPDSDPPFLDFVAGAPVTASLGIVESPPDGLPGATADYFPNGSMGATADYLTNGALGATADYLPNVPAGATSSLDGTPDPAGLPTPSDSPGGQPITAVATTANVHPTPPPFPLPTPPPGGRYLVRRFHRSGGLGAVWVAWDTYLGREVALKTIRPDRRAGPVETDRFVHEARQTGRLEHPCVVPVYDLPATRPGDRPSYVMRLVAGRTLAEAAADYHKGRARGEALALTGLLDAVVAVARAVGFAHSKGVLHRDLKGQNVVIGEYGEVFLLDWGLAREEGGSGTSGGSGSGAVGHTPPGSAVGTPGFMAPEVVARGPATKAADVYGLGGVLYQVLAGRPPYTGAKAEDILRLVETTEPRPVRESNPAVPPALAAVCHKALARDPAARYASADDFATDLRRFLADEPVAAYPEPWPARATRWARRHRTGVAVAAALLVAATIGSAVAAGLVWREKERTATEFARAEGERERAEGEWRRAEAEAKRAEGHYTIAGALAFDLSEKIDSIETGVVSSRGKDLARKTALDDARQAFDKLVADRPDDLTLGRRAAKLHWFAANMGRLLGHVSGTDKAYAESVQQWERVAAAAPTDLTDRDKYVLTLGDLATFQKRDGKLSAAAKTLDRAQAYAVALKPRIRESAYNRTAGVLELDRADVDYRAGRFEVAEAAAGRAAGHLDALAGIPKVEATAVDGVLAASAHYQRGRALLELNRRPEALKEYDDAVARADAAGGDKGTRDARHSANRTRLGRAGATGRDPTAREAAIRELDGVIQKGEALAAEYTTAVAYQELVAEAYLVRGELTAAAGRPAAGDFSKALDTTKKLVNDSGGRVPDHVTLRGRVYLAMGKAAAPAEAAAPLKNAIQVFEIAINGVPMKTKNGDPENAIKGDPENALLRRWREEALRALAALPN